MSVFKNRMLYFLLTVWLFEKKKLYNDLLWYTRSKLIELLSRTLWYKKHAKNFFKIKEISSKLHARAYSLYCGH